MKAELLKLIDFEKINTLLEGFNKTTGFVTAILDLDGKVLSKSGWRPMCTDFHRTNAETLKKCAISDTELSAKLAGNKKFNSYKCLNGLMDVAVPIVIDGKHIANLYSGQFFFEEPDRLFFKNQAKKYGFDEKKYMEALDKVPVISKEKVEVAMDFLLNMTKLISETAFQKMEQIQLNKALMESEQKHRTILQTAMDGFWVVNQAGDLIEVNEAYCAMSGYSEEELLTMNIRDVDVVENVAATKARIDRLEELGHDRFETKHRRKDGREIDVEITVKTVGTESLVVFIRDISQQKMAQNALLVAEWKFKALFELGPIGVAYHRMIYDEAGEPYDYYFIDANNSYKELTGVNPKGMTVRQAFPGIENDPSDWISLFGHVAKTGETIRFEHFLESNQRWYDCVGYQYEPDHFVAAFSEISQRKKAEKALIKKNKDLDYINKFMVNREVRMAEMKKEVNELLIRLGEEKRYL